VKLTVFPDNDERCFLITIGAASTAVSGFLRSVRRVGEARRIAVFGDERLGDPPSAV
jgi:hypothetical protein